MGYIILSHLYYKDKDEYTKLYEQRKSSESTRLLPILIQGNQAFYCLCPDIYDLSTRIMVLDKKVSLIRENLPMAALTQFAMKCLIDEIKLSCDIEHVYSTRSELSAVLDSINTSKKNVRFRGLVQKYSMLSEEDLSLKSCTDIRCIYDELVLNEVKEDAADNVPDGEIFRKGLAEVANSAQRVIHRGAYPESKIIEQMEQALHVLNDSEIPILVRISIFHYLFGYTHPFYDGNGRTSRFISSYLLAQEFDFLIGYRLSYTIKENLSKYYKAFQECNDTKNRGDLTPFIIMFLTIVCESFEKLYEALEKRRNSLLHYRKLIKKIYEVNAFSDEDKKFSDILLQTTLFSDKGITKKKLCDELKISLSTVDKRLEKVRKANVLSEKRGERAYQYALDLSLLTE
ncbi:MAG: Fic family protein [Clostridia bacterium]|nr:Fic family protein [Clostridia bacterium]